MEIDRIQKFRRALGSQGVFYADYDTLPQLQRLVRETTRHCILSWLATSATEVPAADQVTPREEEEEELGILDYMETFETGFRGANDNLSQAIAYLNEFTDFVRAKALAMASLKDSRASDKKKAINEFAHRMSDDAAKIHKSLKAASSKSSEALTALAAALSLQPADMLPRDEALKLLHAMDSLISSAEGAVEKTAGLGLAITQLPRMTAEFNRAKREMLEATDFFRVISAEIIARGTQIKEQLERFSMHNS
jgi:hypothetical protein